MKDNYDPFETKTDNQSEPYGIIKEDKVLQNIMMLFSRVKKVITVAPTHIPRNLWEQFEIYDDGVNRRLYIYGTSWGVITIT